jgi:hypothetical protein
MASFNKAFAAARKELGAGKTFTWNGKSYSTNLAGEDKPKGFSVEAAKSAIDKAVGPKPMKRPAVSTSKDAPMQTSPRPPKKPTELMSTSPVVTPKIITTKLSEPKKPAEVKVAGRGGYASGPAAGMPKATTGGSNSTIVKYLKENNLDKKGVSLTDALVAAGTVGTEAALLKVAYDRLKKGRAANTQGKTTPTKPSPTTTKTPSYKISEATPLKSTATKPEGSKAKTPTTPKNLPPKLNYEDRITRDIKVRADTVARATKANAAADENIKAKAANVARVKAEAATRSAAASKVSADKAARIARAKAVTDKADAAAKAKRENIARVKAKAATRGAAARGGSVDLTRGVGVGTGGFGSAEAIQRALNPLNLAKGGLITKKKK